jgi:hypothetical protein
LRQEKDDGIVVRPGTRGDEAQPEVPMKQRPIRQTRQVLPLDRGVTLEVLGRALIAQADERIKWHRQRAATMATEVKATAPKPDSPGEATDWKQHSRRTDLEAKISGHLEYARFLTFVRRNIVRTRRYRLGLSDMSLLELTPRGSYR